MQPTLKRRVFHQRLFILAGIYNVLWGAYTLWDPGWLFRLADMPPAHYPQLFACLAMVVGVYGFVYWEVARKPENGWVLAAVGLLGKVAGPIGMVQLIVTGQWKIGAIWMCITNDFIWWIPFALYLFDAWPCFCADKPTSEQPLPTKLPIYEHLVQPHYSSLAAGLQAFHQTPSTASGRFYIRRGASWKAKLFALFSPLPSPQENIDLQLAIEKNSLGEAWLRRFDEAIFASQQWARKNGLLAERSGLIEIWFQLKVMDGELHYQSQAVHLCIGPIRLPVPHWIDIHAVESSLNPNDVQTQVTIADRSGSLLVSYGGSLTLQNPSTSDAELFEQRR